MTIEVQNTETTNTFDFWRDRTNELADALTNFVVTTESNTASGNASISGSFSANVLIANTVRVSNSSSNIVISVPNTSQISSGDYYLNANGNWASVVSPVTGSSFETSGTSSQEIDNYAFASFGAVEFFVRVKDNNANKIGRAHV